MNFHTRTAIFAAIFVAPVTLISPVAARTHSHHATVKHVPHSAKRHHAERRNLDADDGPQTEAQVQPYLSGAYPHPRSSYTCLIDASSGKVLYGTNIDAQRPPASLTKIMAATILLENGKLSDIVTAPPDVKGTPESSLHLKPGEKINLEDLLYAMLLRSANDTPIAGATYLSGSIPKFVDLMNQKTIDEGCLNTHFVTPNGLYAPDHYSSAHDLATMAQYAVNHLPMFNEIVKTQEYRIHRSMDKGDTLVVNTSRSYLKFFPGADGIKTGFISQAGHCFVGSATRGGFRLIAVALDSPKCREDVEGMLSYGFAHFTPVVAVTKGTPEGQISVPGTSITVPIATAKNLEDTISKDQTAARPKYSVQVVSLPSSNLKMPIQVGETVGKVKLYASNKLIGAVDAVATGQATAPITFAKHFSLRGRLPNAGRIAGIVVLSVVALLVLSFVTLQIYAGTLAKNSRRRRARLAAEMRGVD